MQPGYFGDAGGPEQCGGSLNHNAFLQQAINAQAQCGPKTIQAERPSTEIESCLSRANNALERLHGRISAVEDRVRPVMRAIGAGQSSSNCKPQEALSPLGDAISGMESRIDGAVDRLEALLLGLAL